jgi:hypothetical protein
MLGQGKLKAERFAFAVFESEAAPEGILCSQSHDFPIIT